MEYALHADDAERSADGSVELRQLFDAGSGCTMFEQRLLRFTGSSAGRTNADDDEVLYVLSGSGTGTFDSGPRALAPGTAVFVARGSSWSVDDADELVVVSVLVRDPLTADGKRHAVVDLAAGETQGATAGRQFRLLATPEVGCASVTQFVGYVPVGRAPDHFHRYDEVIYLLEGQGALHIDGETTPLRPGSCVHLPARLVHCLENVGPGVMQVLGVFRPAGSPAEAYYPDGTPAAVPQGC
ncbi:MAG TPA: cupin domain-containing protein [Gaiellaceae bacterium]